MRIGAWLALTGISALAAGCSGTTVLGTGVGGSGGNGGAGLGIGGSGSSIGGSGSSAGGKGGSGGMIDYAPCAGKACGDTCTTCPPGDTPCIDIGMYCAADGSCGLNYPACTKCSAENPCLTPGLCLDCANGNTGCFKSYCDTTGTCVTSMPACNWECQKDADCAASVAPCEPCKDGSMACPTVACVLGKCQGSVPACPCEACGPAYEPCAGLNCGSKCSPCDPADPICETADVPLSYCDASGTCVASNGGSFPDCSAAATCQTKDDCECRACSSGPLCAASDCVAGKCTYTCPVSPGPHCKVSSDCITDAICTLCSDASCATTECIGGTCVQVCPG